jgi:hypothetical protein
MSLSFLYTFFDQATWGLLIGHDLTIYPLAQPIEQRKVLKLFKLGEKGWKAIKDPPEHGADRTIVPDDAAVVSN